MKNAITIFLALVFVYNTVGFLAVHPFLSIYYKHLGIQRAENPSKEENIEMLVFNKEDMQEGKIDFIWIHSHEFKYNGDIYDLVMKGENDNQLFLYCIIDAEEMNLEEEFVKRVHKNSIEDKQRPTTNNYHFISQSEPVPSEQIDTALVYESLFSYLRTDSYKSLYLDIPSPPPRLV